MLRRLFLGLALLGIPAAAEAKGLNLVQSFPDFTADQATFSHEYGPDGEILKIISSELTYRASVNADVEYFLQASYELKANIDAFGALRMDGGTLSIRDLEAPGDPRLLLAGNLKAYSLEDTVFNFLFEVTSGDMAGDFGGPGAMGGVIFTVLGDGDFDSLEAFDGAGGMVDTFAVVPEPATITSLGLGLGCLGLGALARRRWIRA